MAEVDEYGLQPTRFSTMYSIFHPFTGDYQNTQLSGDGTQPASPGSAFNQQDENSFTRSKMGFKNLVVKDLGQSSAAEAKTGDTSDIEIDPNSDRRKRRRTSPEEDVKGLCDNGVQDTNSERHTKNNQTPAYVSNEEIDAQVVPAVELSSNGAGPSKDHAIVKTPKKRTPQKRRAQMNTGPDDGTSTSPTGLRSDIKPSPSKQKRSTPKKNKKTLSLHANGKLMSSPTGRDASLAKVQESSDKKIPSSKNYKMRNGKFVQSLEIVLKYGCKPESRSELGQKINALLSGTKDGTHFSHQDPSSKTHPFFLGKVKPKPQLHPGDAGAIQTETTDNESESTSRQREPIAWKDIKFTTKKPAVFKSSESVRAAWPPLSLQHIGNELPRQGRQVEMRDDTFQAKMKASLVQLQDGESILQAYVQKLRLQVSEVAKVVTPQKEHLSGAKVASIMQSMSATPHTHDMILPLHSALRLGSSAFDRGECAGPNTWSIQYAPKRHSEVLQPTSSILHQWLQGLAIHNVKTGIDANAAIKKSKVSTRKRRRKPKDEFDDFIVNSDDENEVGKIVKNAILITGPSGCGKTASVFAVAKELGFEVFEIHPGMRRSAKDIFDKVGDMAHNHLVRNGPDFSRSSSAAPSDLSTTIDTDADHAQTNVASMLGSRMSAKAKAADDDTPTIKAKKEQKQSLILFEEVDLLFEDDKGFWNGVQSLIKNTKRPVVLTCNDPSSVPVDELNLYSILEFKPVQYELAVDYLMYLAAAEGHVLDREALSSLYKSKGQDLRAAITEMAFWCQMTVGSKQGGLDWMSQTCSNMPKVDEDGKPLRTFSYGTFQKSLDILPLINTDTEAAFRLGQDSLGIAASEWCDFGLMNNLRLPNNDRSDLQALSLLSDIADARSATDLFDDDFVPVIASVAAGLLGTDKMASDRDIVAQQHLSKFKPATLSTSSLMTSFKPVMLEKPTFPPSQGRLAPSIESFVSNVATDIAPYVRCIVSFDKRLEQHRDDHFGSQGKARKTRAARAAAEGGDKSSTRSERWFPQDLDFEQVLRTGGEWPQWYPDQQMCTVTFSTGSPSASPEA